MAAFGAGFSAFAATLAVALAALGASGAAATGAVSSRADLERAAFALPAAVCGPLALMALAVAIRVRAALIEAAVPVLLVGRTAA